MVTNSPAAGYGTRQVMGGLSIPRQRTLSWQSIVMTAHCLLVSRYVIISHSRVGWSVLCASVYTLHTGRVEVKQSSV